MFDNVEYTLLLLLPGPLWPRVVVPVRVPSMGQIEVFNHVQTNELYWIITVREKYLKLSVCKQMCSGLLKMYLQIMFTNHIWMYKLDLALNSLQGLLCHKKQLTNLEKVLDRNTWNHLTVCKQMINIKGNYHRERNTWNYLTVCK